MQFFQDVYGEYYPTSEIVRITRPKHTRHEPDAKPTPARIYLRGDESVEVEKHVFELLTETGVHAIPASPGFYVLRVWFDSEAQGGYWVDHEPVVGWRTDAEGSTLPIVLDAAFGNLNMEHAYLHPDGKVYGWQGERYGSEADWVAEKVGQRSVGPEGTPI